jgi:hypothetical protein
MQSLEDYIKDYFNLELVCYAKEDLEMTKIKGEFIKNIVFGVKDLWKLYLFIIIDKVIFKNGWISHIAHHYKFIKFINQKIIIK